MTHPNPTPLELAAAYRGDATSDPAVAEAMMQVVSSGGDLSTALNALAGENTQFGRMDGLLDKLVDQTFQALLGKNELVEQLETQRRSVVGKVVAGIGVGAGLISAASGLQIAFAAIVFLYLVPIGVRTAYDQWVEQRQ